VTVSDQHSGTIPEMPKRRPSVKKVPQTDSRQLSLKSFFKPRPPKKAEWMVKEKRSDDSGLGGPPAEEANLVSI